MDAEEIADRLRLDGYPEHVVAEFERRARINLDEARHWLPDRDPLPVGHEAADALDFVDLSDLEYGGFWGVLADGLPSWPAVGIEPGERFPAALWILSPHAFILYVIRNRPGGYAHGSEEYDAELTSFRLGADGTWTEVGGVGSGWYDPFHPPAAYLAKYKVLRTSEAPFATESGIGLATAGLCSPDVAAVEVIDGAGIQRYPVDPVRHTFVVGSTDPPAEIRLLDLSGAQITDSRHRPVTWLLE